MATLLLAQASGASLIHDTVYTNRFNYTKDLNMMGAKIELFRPSEVGLMPTLSDDSYDYARLGEPYTVARVEGPAKLRGTKLSISNLKDGVVLIAAALSAEGRSEVRGIDIIESGSHNFFEKLQKLGAKISLS